MEFLDGQTHQYYDRTVEIAEQCRVILDEAKQTDLLELYSVRETDAEIQKRQELTNSVTAAALEPVFAYYESVRNADGFLLEVEGNEVTKDRLAELFGSFHSQKTLREVAFEAAIWASKLDPNAWMIIEREITGNPGEGRKISSIYPILVSSSQVVWTEQNNAGIFVRMAYENERIIDGRPVTEFWEYAPGNTRHYIENDPAKTQGLDLSAYLQAGDFPFVFRDFPNTLTEIPCIRLSAYLSDMDDREIGVPLYASAMPMLKDLIRDKSYLDLQKTLHIRPEKLQYVKPCDHYDEDTGLACENGYLGGVRADENLCPACGGSGKLISVGEQRVTTLRWPEKAEDLVDLVKLTHYVERPIETVEFYRKEIDSTLSKVVFAVFSQQNANAEALTSMQTATQVVVEAEKVNNKLQAFARLVGDVIEKAYRVGFAYFNQRPESVQVAFPAVFKFRTLMELMQEYQTAVQVGAPYEVRWSIMSEMLGKIYKSDPGKSAMAEALERWRPWKSLTFEQASYIAAQRSIEDTSRVIWENWDLFSDMIREGHEDLPFLDYQAQKAVVSSVAAEILSSLSFPDSSFPGGVEYGQEA